VQVLRITPEQFDLGAVQRGTKQRYAVKVGEFASGAPVELAVTVVRGRDDGPTAFIGAGVHGEEPAGMDTVKRLARELDPEQVSGTVIALPLINVPAYVHRQRLYPLDAPTVVDIGGAQPDKDGVLSTRILWAVVDCIAKDIDHALDIHATHLDSINYPRAMLTSPGDLPEDLERRRLELGRACGFEIIHRWTRKGRSGGPTGIFCRRGVPAIAIEAGEGWRNLYPFPEMMLRASYNFLKAIGVVPGEPELPAMQVEITKRYEVTASKGGMSHLKVKTGDYVRKGQLLAEIRDLYDDVVEELLSPTNGIIVRTSLLPIVNTGARVCNVYETDEAGWETREVPELERHIVVSGF
jgi:predicted deacylase